MYWANFLHIYQPVDQQKDVLDRIVNESYRPLVKNWLANQRTKVTLNINACLTEMLWHGGYQDVVKGLKKLGEEGKIEFTASAKYHPFLPILPKDQIIRQIKLNNQTNRRFLGRGYQPQGFFPPEMGYSPKVAEVISKQGFRWVILDEIAFPDDLKNDRLYQYKNLHIFFRERRMSDLLSSNINTANSWFETLEKRLLENNYLLTAMDGETFGHHRPGLERVLDELQKDSRSKLVTISELIKLFKKDQQIDPRSCSWATTKEELDKGIPFYLYYNSQNKLHRLQKRLIDLAIRSAKRFPERQRFLDQALSCNHMWWSNPDSWWSIEELEKGAYALKKIIRQEQGEKLYQKILSLAFFYQRSGLIRKLHMRKESFKTIPFKKRAKPGEYEAIMEILKKQEKKAVERKEYELAIKYRNAQITLEKELDVYSWYHIVDELRTEGKLDDYPSLTEKYRK